MAVAQYQARAQKYTRMHSKRKKAPRRRGREAYIFLNSRTILSRRTIGFRMGGSVAAVRKHRSRAGVPLNTTSSVSRESDTTLNTGTGCECREGERAKRTKSHTYTPYKHTHHTIHATNTHTTKTSREHMSRSRERAEDDSKRRYRQKILTTKICSG